jgi:hypothetical protein
VGKGRSRSLHRDMKDESKRTFPRRDRYGRAVSLAELLAAMIIGIVVGVVVLAALDLIIVALGGAAFGSGSGWLAVVLPGLVLLDDFRAWRTAGPRRIVAALAAAALGLVIGLGAAYLMRATPHLVAGAVGATVLVGVYTVVWFVWIRWLTGDQVEEGRP